MNNNIYTPEFKKDLKAFVMAIDAQTKAKAIIAEGIAETRKEIINDGGSEADVKHYVENELPKDPDFLECVNLTFQTQYVVGVIAQLVVPHMKIN